MAITKVPCSPRASASARLGSSRVDSKALPSAPAYAGALPFTTRWKARSGIWESCWYWVSCWQRSRSFCAIARSSRRPHLRQATTRVRCCPRASGWDRLAAGVHLPYRNRLRRQGNNFRSQSASVRLISANAAPM